MLNKKTYIISFGLILFFSVICNIFSDNNKIETPDRIWIAVHDFTVSQNLRKDGVSGWNIAGRIENELVQKSDFKVLTRAKISKVLKEKNIKSTGSLNASNFGKMIGADFIVTGQLTYNGNKLTLVAKLLDASGETGEIEKSFDITKRVPKNKSPKMYFDELFEEVTNKLTMTPGEFLDYGIEMMNEGKFVQAVDAFREVKRNTPIEKIREITAQYQPYDYKIKYLERKRSPGDLLDYGIKAIKKKEYRDAVSVFKYFSKITPYEQIKSLMQVGDMIEDAQNKAALQQKTITETITKASNMYMTAKGKDAKKFEEMSPEELCDKALTELETLLINPKIHLTEYDRESIKEMINDIKAFRGTLFAGPMKQKYWTLKELKIKMIPIKSGFFEMGNPESLAAVRSGETPDDLLHIVTISQSFWISQKEITINQFLYYLKNPVDDPNTPDKYDRDKNINWNSKYCPITKSYRMKRGKGKTWGNGDLPMVCLNWKAASQFCEWLTLRERKEKRLPEGYIYRLPTESEWEYCCKAGTKTAFGSKDINRNTLYEYVWYEGNSMGKTNLTGIKKPNAWGIYDMHGNVWEWCFDWYGPYLEEATDPLGPDESENNEKIVRGGSFASDENDLKAYVRYPVWYKATKKNIGFRIVLAPEI